jgi:hypothetical protein
MEAKTDSGAPRDKGLDPATPQLTSGTAVTSSYSGSLSVAGTTSLDNSDITTDGSGDITPSIGVYPGNAGALMRMAQVTIPSSTILGMTGTGATDAVILAAAPSGKYYYILDVSFTLNFNSVAYTTTAANFAFYYTNGSTRYLNAVALATIGTSWLTPSVATTANVPGAVAATNYLTSSLYGSSYTFGPTAASTVSNGNSPVVFTVLYLVLS